MEKRDIKALAEKYREKAEKAFDDYQQTGHPRYDRERRNAEDLADALSAAANAAEDHALLGALKAEVIWIAGAADKALAHDAQKETLEKLLRDIIETAKVFCHYAEMAKVFCHYAGREKMNEELIADLRRCADGRTYDETCRGCHFEHERDCTACIMLAAADEIERLRGKKNDKERVH